jgi:hypothetical protein
VDALAAVGGADTAAEVTTLPVSDGFAAEVFPFVYGQPLRWRDASLNGGVDSRGTPWNDITWDTLVWDDLTWQNLAWEAFNWLSVSWQDIAWEDIAWEDIMWETGSRGPTGSPSGVPIVVLD